MEGCVSHRDLHSGDIVYSVYVHPVLLTEHVASAPFRESFSHATQWWVSLSPSPVKPASTGLAWAALSPLRSLALVLAGPGSG